MGTNSSLPTSVLSIKFFNENENIYEVERDLKGIVRLLDDIHPIDDVIIQFIGELVYTTYARKGRSTITTDNQVPFFLKTIQYQPSEKHEKNQYEFSFYLNSYLPPSFEQLHSQGPFIHYFIRIRSLNHHFKEDFPIIIRRSPQNLVGSVRHIKNQPFDSIQFNVHLENNLALMGQNLPFQIDLHNPTRRTIDRISCKFVQIRKLGPAKEERKVLFKENLIHFDKFKDEDYHGKFQVTIPFGVNPTCTFHLPNQWFIFVYYEIIIKIHQRGFSKSSSLTVPVLIDYQSNVKSDLNSTHIDQSQSVS
ncbi:unnamed protein product [Adineta ricciae]|uniref:Arrestin C-terminal-like domain-containing protein n=1 Tax=Adineta ricciae TaxID=249248 RepID=A0A815G9G2_ADIRI|nr:unnamed protein product [Adineta ricciae]CAF1335599.1 unnamed protein product [Adineta ricciae]